MKSLELLKLFVLLISLDSVKSLDLLKSLDLEKPSVSLRILGFINFFEGEKFLVLSKSPDPLNGRDLGKYPVSENILIEEKPSVLENTDERLEFTDGENFV